MVLAVCSVMSIGMYYISTISSETSHKYLSFLSYIQLNLQILNVFHFRLCIFLPFTITTVFIFLYTCTLKLNIIIITIIIIFKKSSDL